MPMEEVELILNNILIALQISLGLWQFLKLTPVGALVQGITGCLLRLFRLSSTYARLQHCDGHVFKRLNCYVLQADIPSDRTDIHRDGVNKIKVKYLGEEFTLERRGMEDENMLFINGKMCYYITHTIWEELHILCDAATAAVDADDAAAAAAGYAAAAGGYAAAAAAGYASAAAAAATSARSRFLAADVVDAGTSFIFLLAYKYFNRTVFVKGSRNFWEEVVTGGVMSFGEVLDGIILYNQHVSLPLDDDWLLPINLSVSEEKLLKVLNLFALFLQTKKGKVSWLIPLSLSFIAALLEFNTRLRVWLYDIINMVFCYTLQLICDPLPRSWRVQIYSLGKWVENLKPSNDIQLKVVRGNMRAIIVEGAKVDKEGATKVSWSSVVEERADFMEQFHCRPIGSDIICRYIRKANACEIYAGDIGMMYVDCKTSDDFSHIITLVSCMANNCCGSLISYGPNNNKVLLRGFKESIRNYVKHGLPPIYELELENVIVV